MHLPLSQMLRAGRLDGIEAVAALRRSPDCELLMKAYDALRTELLYKSEYHGSDHIERVMLLGALIAMRQKFTPRQTELLLIACSYHDIGRLNDSVDERHGQRSADALASIPGLDLSPEELSCIRAAVATHSTKDTRLASFAEAYQVPEEYWELCLLLCRGLKDADNLDRVRLNDLDVRHLRFEESRAMKPVAEAVYRLSRAR